MADEVVYSNWFERLGKSFVGVLIGICLFFGSFVLLYWNEGNLDISKYAKAAVDVPAEAPAGAADGLLVDLVGKVESDETLGDQVFLNPGKYLLMERKAEIYAWQEKKEEKTKKDAVGGGSTTEITYNYEKKWMSPTDVRTDFHKPAGHDNSQAQNALFSDAEAKAQVVKMGRYTMSTNGLTLPAATPLTALETTLTLKPMGRYRPTISDGYVYLKKRGPDQTEIGDERVSYKVLAYPFNGTAFGKLSGNTLQSFTVKGAGGDTLKHTETLFRLFAGDKEQALVTMHGEFVTMLWVLRIIGFLAMWIGAMMVFDPLSTILDIVGVVGSVSRFLINTVLFVITLVLSGVTILISMITHNLIVLLLVVAAIIGLVIFVMVQQKGKTVSAAK